jgi:hypothetical protein
MERMDKKTKLSALAMLSLFGLAMVLFIIASDEQSIRSGGTSEATRMTLKELVAKDPPLNKHIELTAFDFGKVFIYNAKLVQFKDVYLPVFPQGEEQSVKNLKLLIWIRNDQNSNEPLIETRQQLEQFVSDFQKHPTAITGVLKHSLTTVNNLTLDAYPGADTNSLRLLWARKFPTQESTNTLWGLCALSFVASIAFGFCLKVWKGKSTRRASPR